jgi:Nitrile hydratase beta subunit
MIGAVRLGDLVDAHGDGRVIDEVMQKLDERSALLYHPVNDLGGATAAPVNLAEHALLPWEKRCHALLETFNARGVISMEEKRRGVEELGQTIYAGLTYYEKWVMSAVNNLLAKGLITTDELAAKLAEVRARFT